MIVFLGWSGKAINKQEMNFYCEVYCKYKKVCTQHNNSFTLASTTRAIQRYKTKDRDLTTDFWQRPYRTEELSFVVSNVIEEEKNNAK